MSNCDDIKPGWLCVARQMQGASRSGGHSIVTISVVCGPDGTPVTWGEPKQVLLFPRGIDKATVLRLLTGGETGSTI